MNNLISQQFYELCCTNHYSDIFNARLLIWLRKCPYVRHTGPSFCHVSSDSFVMPHGLSTCAQA